MYNIGDNVRIKPDLNYSMNNVAEEMVEYAGKIATIIDRFSSIDYKLDIDDGEYYWNEHMFTPLEMYKIGDTVQIKPDLRCTDGVPGCSVPHEMLQHAGKIGTITKISTTNTDFQTIIYMLNIPDIDYSFWYPENILSLVIEEPKESEPLLNRYHKAIINLKDKYPDLKTDEDFNLLTELVILISNFFGDGKND